jgi:hypothetical protein
LNGHYGIEHCGMRAFSSHVPMNHDTLYDWTDNDFDVGMKSVEDATSHVPGAFCRIGSWEAYVCKDLR